MGPTGCPGRSRKGIRKWIQKWTQNRSKMDPEGGPRWTPERSRMASWGGALSATRPPRPPWSPPWAKMASKMVQDGPQGTPWEPTMGQNGFQHGPGWAPRGLWDQKWTKMGPKIDQFGARTAPGRTEIAPHEPRDEYQRGQQEWLRVRSSHAGPLRTGAAGEARQRPFIARSCQYLSASATLSRPSGMTLEVVRV